MSNTSLLSFSELLESQLDDTLPYPSLKRLLRTLRSTHPAYPTKPSTASPLSQTQPIRAQTQNQSEMSVPHPHSQSLSLHFSQTTPFKDITNLPEREQHQSSCRTARDVGASINAILNRLLDCAEQPVTWYQLRAEIVHQSASYERFCNSMDRMFACDDRLAVPPSCTSNREINIDHNHPYASRGGKLSLFDPLGVSFSSLGRNRNRDRKHCPGPTMASEIKLFEMDKKDMHYLKQRSFLILLVSVLISSLSTALLHIYSGRQESTTNLPIPLGFIVAEFTFSALISLITITAIRSHLQKRYYLEDHQKHINRLLLILLISAFSFSVPFRSSAEIIRRENGHPSWVFLMCSDGATAIGSCLLLIFLWTYPSIWAGTSEGTVAPDKACVCILYAVLRFAFSFAFQIHFEPLPVQHLFSLTSILTQVRNEGINPVPLSLILGVSTLEVILILCIYWNYSSSSAALCNANDPSKQQSIIALWYYSRAVMFLCVSMVVAGVARLLSPATQAVKLLQQTSVILLSGPVGNSAVSLAVLTYALREIYVHSYTEEIEVPFAMSPFIGSFSSLKHEKTLKEVDEDLLYRIADERDPQNEDPIPQPNTFSFESAILLFNTCWLATTYATRGVKPLTPSDFGRPMSAVRAVVSDANNAVTAVILERMDRLIIAFKPVLPVAERHSDLRVLSKTDFGKTLSSASKDEELLSLMEKSVRNQKLFSRCRLHHGFSKAYSAIQSELHTHVRDLTMDTSRPLYITGFGSGGALATICAFDLSFRQISETNSVSLYTYGSPRVMGSNMVVLFEKVVPCRWRCVVAGDSNTVKPSQTSYGHFSKVATFTRSGHLALEWDRVYKWWQSEVSAHPMHKISAYYCAFAKWHKYYHIKGSIDLWDWHIDPIVGALFHHETGPTDLMKTADFMLESPIVDVEAKSLRTLGASVNWPTAPLDEVVAFKR